MTDVKICGMMSETDVHAAGEADYVGFILQTDSRRCISVTTAKRLMAIGSSKKVVVTTLNDVGRILSLVRELRPDVLQVHSLFSLEDMERLRSSLVCALWFLLPVGKEVQTQYLTDIWEFADKIVLDTPSPRGGGSGCIHDWEVSAAIARFVRPTGCVLAGGLNPENVRRAIDIVHPDVVDVSSGVELEGAKSAALISQFIQKVDGSK